MQRVLIPKLAVALVALGALGACKSGVSSSGPGATPCVTYKDCAGGEVCVDGKCATICMKTSQCPEGQVCDKNACVPDTTPSPDAPVITSIEGTGSSDDTPGHTTRHLKDRIIVNGERLKDAVATLTGINPVRAAVTLAPCLDGTDTRLEVALPTEIVAGEYQLSVANQAGVCNANLNLLQGEPGSLDASGAQLVTAINDTLADNPLLTLRGALSGEVTSIFATAAVSTVSARSIMVKGQEQATSADPGLYLVTFDLDTHTVVDVQSTIGFRSKGNFRPDVPLQIAGLNDVLGTLTDNQAIVLASAGSVTALLHDPTLNAQLKLFGASALIDTVTASDAYILIGLKHIGEGNGLEQTAGALRGGIAAAATVAINQALAGLKQTPPQDARYVNTSGDTVEGTLTFQSDPVFNNNAIPGSKIADGTVTPAEISFNYAASASKGGAALDTADVNCSGCVGTGDLADGGVTTAKILDGTIATADIGNNQVTSAKIADAYAASATKGGAALEAAGVNCSGCVDTADLADSSVTTAKILDGTITTADIGNSQVTSAKIADGTISTADIADSQVTTAKILDGTIATADLGDSQVTSLKIADGTISTADIADSQVTTAKILDGTIATADLGDTQVTGAKIANGTITTAKVAAGSISAALYQGPTGCGSLITTATTCSTLWCCDGCYWGGPNYFTCAGSCSPPGSTSPVSCPTTFLGYMLK
jgi:hypothetical protein